MKHIYIVTRRLPCISEPADYIRAFSSSGKANRFLEKVRQEMITNYKRWYPNTEPIPHLDVTRDQKTFRQKVFRVDKVEVQ